MSKLIDELRGEHAKMAEALNRVKELGIGSEESTKLLVSTEASFLAHLKKEDEQLYPILKKAAMTDEELAKKLKSFAEDMDEISRAAMKFFGK